MRIGLVASVARTIDAFFGDWIANWEACGHEVFTVALGPSISSQRHFCCDTLTQNPRPRNLRAIPDLRHWADRQDLDVVITNTATASAVARLASAHAVPCIYFCHGLHWPDPGRSLSGPLYRMLERTLTPFTAGVITINRDDERWFERSRVPVLRLPAGVGLDTSSWAQVREARAAAQEQKVDDHRPLRLLGIGSLTRRKRPSDLVRVATVLSAMGHDLDLTILGDGPLEAELRAMSRTAPFPVRVLGFGDPRPHYANADVLVHTASWEGLPRVLLEAAAVGLPSVAWDVKGCRDAPGVSLAGRPGDYRAMADAILKLTLGRLEYRLIDLATLDFLPCWQNANRFVERVISD